jgi:hypothetical protein
VAFLPVPKNGRDIGQCIYCDSIDESLTKEHAVPYGLNGPWTLLRASCRRCADITHRFERDSLRGLFPTLRAVLRMQTRRPSQRPRTLPLVLESRGVQRTVQVPLTDFPLYLPAPRLPQPRAVTGDLMAHGASVKMDFIHVAGPSFESVSQRYTDVDFVGAHLSFLPEEFARTLAKIAFCAGVYTLGLAPLRQSPIRQVVLGNDRDVWHWVGSWTGDPVNEPKGLHAMQVRASGSDIHVILRLFAQFGAPEYHIVLGAADPEFVSSAAWPWK